MLLHKKYESLDANSWSLMAVSFPPRRAPTLLDAKQEMWRDQHGLQGLAEPSSKISLLLSEDTRLTSLSISWRVTGRENARRTRSATILRAQRAW